MTSILVSDESRHLAGLYLYFIETSEGLPLAGALIHYSRTRFIHNFLPELQAATSLKILVSVFAATKEGPFSGVDDTPGEKLSLLSRRGHAASLVTLGMEAYAKMAPDVSFIHDFPGPVKSGIGELLSEPDTGLPRAPIQIC